MSSSAPTLALCGCQAGKQMLCIATPLAEACKFKLVKTEIFDFFRAGRALEKALNEAFNEAFTEAFKEALRLSPSRRRSGRTCFLIFS
jgi:hypothetical protein